MSTRGPLDQRPSEPGWWLASDGRWYPPESAPAGAGWTPPPSFGYPGARRRARWVIPVIVAVLLAFGGCGVAVVAVMRNHSVRETITAVGHGADRFYTSESESMAPTVEVGDRFAATTKIGTIERGDVLVVNSPARTSPQIFKRVVGLPDETIEARGGQVFVNGAPLPESYLAAGTVTAAFPPTRIPIDSYFLLGDNRANSLDSRTFGAIGRAEVVAVVLRVITPASRAGPLAGSPRD